MLTAQEDQDNGCIINTCVQVASDPTKLAISCQMGNLTREMVETHSFYSLLYHVGIVPFAADDSYEAVVLDPQQAKLLGVAEGSCAFFHQRRTKTEDGRIYEYTRRYIRGDRVRLDAHMQKGAITFTRTSD